MRNLLPLLLATSLLVPNCVAETPKELEKKVDAYLQPYVDFHTFSGAVLIAKGDEVLLNKGYGMANYEFGVPNKADTRFAIASITKRFAGIVLDRLVEEKKLSMDDLLSKWVPDFPSADKITVMHLRTHYSGVRDPAKLRRIIRMSYRPAEVVEKLKSEPLGSAPGETYSYTTANYAILAHVIERVTGAPWAEAVQKYVFTPAAMKDSGELVTTRVVPRLANGYMPDVGGKGLAVCGPEDASWKAAGGSSYSTTADLHRFARAWFGKKLSPVDPNTANLGKMHDHRVSTSSGSFPGAGANLLYFPDDEVTVVVLTNNYSTVAGAITGDLAAMQFGLPLEVPKIKLSGTVPASVAKLVGSYKVQDRPWTFDIVMQDGKPVVAYNEVRRAALLHVQDDLWFMPFDWTYLQVKRDEQGNFLEGEWRFQKEAPLKVTRR